MKLLITSLWILLSTGLAASRALADVRPPPGTFDDLAGPGMLISATFLTTGFILAGL